MKRILDINQFLHGGDYNPEQWWDEPDVINQDFALFKQAKINTVTVGIFSWPKLEPQEENYDFSWLDEIFDLVEEMNGHVILATPSGDQRGLLKSIQKSLEQITGEINAALVDDIIIV